MRTLSHAASGTMRRLSVMPRKLSRSPSMLSRGSIFQRNNSMARGTTDIASELQRRKDEKEEGGPSGRSSSGENRKSWRTMQHKVRVLARFLRLQRRVAVLSQNISARAPLFPKEEWADVKYVVGQTVGSGAFATVKKCT